MANEFDDACESEILRRAGEPGAQARVGRERSRRARLVARIYAGANAWHRPRLVEGLLRPLGPLAVVAVASGAFAGLLDRLGGGGPGIGLEDLARVSNEHVLELARFVEQVSPDAFANVANTIVESPAGISTLTAAATLLLLRAMRGGGGAKRAKDTGVVADELKPSVSI